MKKRYFSSKLAVTLFLAAQLTSVLLHGTDPASYTKKSSELDFPKELTSKLPYDVNVDALRVLSTTPDHPTPPYTIPEANIPKAQRWFDLFAWQAFLALNWPALENGEPDNSKTLADAETPRVWEYYVDISQVFRPDGEEPLPWNKISNGKAEKTLWMEGLGLGQPADRVKVPGETTKPLLDESLQAFTGPMVDQNGRWVRYQVSMNEIEYDFLVEHKLYNLDGQVAYTAHNQISFPTNQGTNKHGAMEIKLSWKQLGENDDRSRFLVRHCRVAPLTGEPFEGDFGLVGMHISARTQSSPTWIWATFEQVDNTATNDLEPGHNGKPRRPNFFNPDNPVKPVNVLPAKNAGCVAQFNPATGKNDGPSVPTTWDESKTTDPTQTLMVLPIPKATAELNRQVQAVLGGIGSVFQYYELIGSQWPSDPEFPAFPNGVAARNDGRLVPASPESILFKVPGKVVPVHLVNTTMETFFQNGNQPAGPLAQDDRLPPGVVADPNTVFATESCAGCHFSAGSAIAFKKDMNLRTVVTKMNDKYYPLPVFGVNAIRGVNGNADYSWLLQLRAMAKPVPAEKLGPDFDKNGESKDYILLEKASGVLYPQARNVCPAK